MPAEAGFRWPAEWEPHAATWLSWPHNAETWPCGLRTVEETFAGLVRVLSGVERVCINVCDGRMADRVGECLRASGVGAGAGAGCGPGVLMTGPPPPPPPQAASRASAPDAAPLRSMRR